jgi:hypothetical protein
MSLEPRRFVLAIAAALAAPTLGAAAPGVTSYNIDIVSPSDRETVFRGGRSGS